VRQRRTKRKSHGRAWRTAGLAALLSLLLVGLSGSLATVAVTNYYAGDLPSIEQLESSTLPQATRIYDRNGQLIDTVYDYNRTVVPLSKIAKPVQQATIATEDRDFYNHQGVDWRRLAAAGLYDVTHGSAAQGGSTITEQVIKNDVLADQAQDKVFSRKLKELVLAEELERRFTKDQILELYLNSIFYGHGAFGIQAAADTYFGAQASQLDLAESSFLVGLPQWPGEYDPLGSPAQQAAAKARWRQVLDAMVAHGDIDKAQADKAFAEDIEAKMQAHHKAATGRDPRTAHFVDYVEQYLVSKYGAKVLRQGGLRVVTTLDLGLQLDADQKVKAGVAQYKGKGANTGALLAMNPLDGEILAMVGSADYNNDSIRGQVNLTGVDPNGFGDRPPGSSFKPYTYGYALERGLVTAATLVDDQHDAIGSPPHKFSDWDGKKEGMIPLRQALAESRNLPALWTYSQVGGQNVVAYARKLGVDTSVENPGSIATTWPRIPPIPTAAFG
jgi:membrane peptidoglycan carboxypeptidase